MQSAQEDTYTRHTYSTWRGRDVGSHSYHVVVGDLIWRRHGTQLFVQNVGSLAYPTALRPIGWQRDKQSDRSDWTGNLKRLNIIAATTMDLWVARPHPSTLLDISVHRPEDLVSHNQIQP
jgi:hypothetical protein